MITPCFISSIHELSERVLLQESEKKDLEEVVRVYPFRIPAFYAALMSEGNRACPIRLQAVPSTQELRTGGEPDPLGEAGIEVTPSFLKRYPRRGVFLVSSECAMYCRFCNRKRAVGKGHAWEEFTDDTLRYLEKENEISEVILSGGDPLMLAPQRLAYILERLRTNKKIHVVRISTRVPVVFPEGVQQEHLEAIRKNEPIWVIIHINHPREVTSQFAEVVNRLRKAGALLVSQTVLLRGVNDCPHILSGLLQDLVRLGVKPYYLFQLDDVQGAQHFKARISTGFALMSELRRRLSGLCIPQYALDITGGMGKVPLNAPYVGKRKGKSLLLQNLEGNTGTYADDGRKSRCQDCGFCRGAHG
jgi:lysine 2,3-aminomutase